MTTDSRIDALVAKLARSGVKVQRAGNTPWVSDLEGRFKNPLPASFRSLITRYLFPVLEFKKLELFSNLGDGSEYDLTRAPFRDPHMSPWLIENRLIWFAHPYVGDYDPICFDVASSASDEPPIIKLDHEDILLERKKVERTPVAASFLVLLQDAIDA